MSNEVENKIREIVDGLLEDFKAPDSLDRMAVHIIPIDDRPCAHWSFMNRLIVRHHKTEDARGFNQWNDLGRQIKGGSKAIHIVIPNIRKVKEKDAKTGEEKERTMTIGFFRRPVFKLEDTTGKPVEYPVVTPVKTPPLLGVAKSWGIDVRYGPYLDSCLGWANGTTGEIRLASHDDKVFFHELVHLAHQKSSKKKLKAGQDPKQEIIAEFGAAILMRMYGIKGEGNAYDYIKQYSMYMAKEDVVRACGSVLKQVEQSIRAIILTDMGEDESNGA